MDKQMKLQIPGPTSILEINLFPNRIEASVTRPDMDVLDLVN